MSLEKPRALKELPPSKTPPKPMPLINNNRFRALLLKKRASLHKSMNVSAHKKPPIKTVLTTNAARADKSNESEKLRPLDFPSTHSSHPSNVLGVPIERLIEENISVLAHAKIANQADEDINRLIRKLTMSFTAKKHESQFSITLGIFQGAQFHLVTDKSDLSLKVSHVSESAKTLLINHTELLQKRLAKHEINLHEMRFSS